MNQGKIISIFNNKGGTGKTTSVINIAAVLNQKGFKILVIDLDSQANLTNCLLKEKCHYTMHNAYKEKGIELGKLKEIKNEFFLLGADSSLLDLNFSLEKERIGQEKKLKELLDPIKIEFDYILIDTPPSISISVVNALYASDYFLTPLETDFFSLVGLNEVLKLKEEINETKKLECLGVFFTRVEETNISSHIKTILSEKIGNILLKSVIRKNVAIREAQNNNETILSYDPNSNGAKDYEQLVNELIEKMKEDE